MAVLVGAGEASAQYCVRYARSLTDFDIRGNAWTWWDGAAGRYERGSEPMEGAVLVFRRGHGGMRLGHVSTVTGQIDDRTILVTHSFGGPTLWRDVPVIDTSANNDWTEVRVWSGRANVMGSTEFATYGFIYPLAYGVAPTVPSVASTPIAQGPAWDVLQSIPLPSRPPSDRARTAQGLGSLEAASGTLLQSRIIRPRWDEAEEGGLGSAVRVRTGFATAEFR